MNQTSEHIASPVASHSCTSGNSMQQISTPYYKKRHIRIKELLKERLSKLGSIRTGDAWQICRHEFEYGAIQFHFKCIMMELVREQKADRIRNGLYFIHKK